MTPFLLRCRRYIFCNSSNSTHPANCKLIPCIVYQIFLLVCWHETYTKTPIVCKTIAYTRCNQCYSLCGDTIHFGYCNEESELCCYHTPQPMYHTTRER